MTYAIQSERPRELFQELVLEALARQDVKASDESARYLVHLLDDFVRPDHIAARAVMANDMTLAELLCRALGSEGSRRFTLLKHTGDVALFMAGFFPVCVRRSAASLDYHRNLGGYAYNSAASDSHSTPVASLFRELSEGFDNFVNVLGEVSDCCCAHDDANLLQLYEKWQQTGSPHTAKILRQAGVVLPPHSRRQEPC